MVLIAGRGNRPAEEWEAQAVRRMAGGPESASAEAEQKFLPGKLETAPISGAVCPHQAARGKLEGEQGEGRRAGKPAAGVLLAAGGKKADLSAERTNDV